MSLPVAIILGIIFVPVYTYIGMQITFKYHNYRRKLYNIKPMSNLRIYTEAIFLVIAGIAFVATLIYIAYFS